MGGMRTRGQFSWGGTQRDRPCRSSRKEGMVLRKEYSEVGLRRAAVQNVQKEGQAAKLDKSVTSRGVCHAREKEAEEESRERRA